jgi:hypothetical protein
MKEKGMALDVYFQEDILKALRAAHAASEGSAALVAEMLDDPDLGQIPLSKLLGMYRRGYQTALGVIGLAFGLDPTGPERERWAEVTPERGLERLLSSGSR